LEGALLDSSQSPRAIFSIGEASKP